MFQFPIAAVRNSHKLYGLQHKFIYLIVLKVRNTKLKVLLSQYLLEALEQNCGVFCLGHDEGS